MLFSFFCDSECVSADIIMPETRLIDRFRDIINKIFNYNFDK